MSAMPTAVPVTPRNTRATRAPRTAAKRTREPRPPRRVVKPATARPASTWKIPGQQAEKLQEGGAGRGQCGLRNVSHARRACAVGQQPARGSQPVMHHVPLGARRQVAERAAQGRAATGCLRELPSRQSRQARSLGSHAGARRQDAVFNVPQHARFHERQTSEEGRFHRRALHLLSCGQARAVPVGARAKPRRMRDLPRPARFFQRAHACRKAANPLSAVSCGDAASEHDL